MEKNRNMYTNPFECVNAAGNQMDPLWNPPGWD